VVDDGARALRAAREGRASAALLGEPWARRWDRITYKGGSEPGVLNFSTRVEKGGVVHCVVATWNHEETLENDELARPYARLLASLGGG
jgi:hypothetical protein